MTASYAGQSLLEFGRILFCFETRHQTSSHPVALSAPSDHTPSHLSRTCCGMVELSVRSHNRMVRLQPELAYAGISCFSMSSSTTEIDWCGADSQISLCVEPQLG